METGEDSLAGARRGDGQTTGVFDYPMIPETGPPTFRLPGPGRRSRFASPREISWYAVSTDAGISSCTGGFCTDPRGTRPSS